MNKNSLYFVMDAESYGLYGQVFSWACVVFENGKEIFSCYHTMPPRLARRIPSDEEWIEKNVVRVMDHLPQSQHVVQHDNYAELMDSFLGVWLKWQKQATLVADCPFPVESSFIRDCIDFAKLVDPERAKDISFYPVIDVASVRLGVGLDPMETVERRPDELPVHHPLADARQSARLLMQALAVGEM